MHAFATPPPHPLISPSLSKARLDDETSARAKAEDRLASLEAAQQRLQQQLSATASKVEHSQDTLGGRFDELSEQLDAIASAISRRAAAPAGALGPAIVPAPANAPAPAYAWAADPDAATTQPVAGVTAAYGGVPGAVGMTTGATHWAMPHAQSSALGSYSHTSHTPASVLTSAEGHMALPAPSFVPPANAAFAYEAPHFMSGMTVPSYLAAASSAAAPYPSVYGAPVSPPRSGHHVQTAASPLAAALRSAAATTGLTPEELTSPATSQYALRREDLGYGPATSMGTSGPHPFGSSASHDNRDLLSSVFDRLKASGSALRATAERSSASAPSGFDPQ